MAESDGTDSAGGVVAARTVFLSYASHDTEIANTVCRELESRGIRCWIATAGRGTRRALCRRHRPGHQRGQSPADRAIAKCGGVVACWAGKSSERLRNASRSSRFGSTPATLSPELEYFLSNSQWIDVTALGVPGALTKLADAVGRDSTTSPKSNPALGAAATLIGKRSDVAPKRAVVLAGIIIVVTAVAILVIRLWPSEHRETQVPATGQISEKSIAVLPFADMSEKKDQEYFGETLASRRFCRR